ncbi:Uncharacterized protein conserved in bacteria [uncultured Ruminococcus sp.]|uniref:ubiquitin-like domain-containing protein n=1 Tax=Massiliimalia timonensis TaxID=1987501 RepID=UPI000823534C|nr:ubiquitin-like domain-containing protein [Massiliimalia timonensis]MBS7175189.1 G5 domain-containing protein [Clostridiales bacterium]SCG99712.1 Uncharacterized protein conserved in bacteria [uncultured Clostridium sp.]SCH95469.1 Uncharacterized protein conserved in bacteria [uncultured Ruminococcus sp.]
MDVQEQNKGTEKLDPPKKEQQVKQFVSNAYQGLTDQFSKIGTAVAENTQSFVKGVASKRLSRTMSKVLAIGLIGTMTLAVCTGLTVADHRIAVYEGDEVYYRYTPYSELEDILEEQKITLGKDDICVFSGFNSENEASIVVKRAFNVTVSADGETQTVVMAEGTVKDALKKAGVTYSEDDLINVPLTEQAVADMNIQINRVTFKTFEETEEIPFETKRPDQDCPSNQREVVTQTGRNGEKILTKQTRFVDGVEKETTLIKETVSKEPVDKVIEYRAKVSWGGSVLKYDSSDLQLDENGIPKNYKYKVTGKATAYSALGRPTQLVPGCVAMDLSRFPKGTKLYIRTPSGSYVYGYSKVADTGAFVHNGSGVLVDLFFNTYEESCRFGAKTVDVYVLE